MKSLNLYIMINCRESQETCLSFIWSWCSTAIVYRHFSATRRISWNDFTEFVPKATCCSVFVSFFLFGWVSGATFLGGPPLCSSFSYLCKGSSHVWPISRIAACDWAEVTNKWNCLNTFWPIRWHWRAGDVDREWWAPDEARQSSKIFGYLQWNFNCIKY